jgi:hypothetical protein
MAHAPNHVKCVERDAGETHIQYDARRKAVGA